MFIFLIVYYLLASEYLHSSIASVYCSLALLPISSSDTGKLYRRILKYMSWPHIERFKKHSAVAHCANVPENLTQFRSTWKGVSGIYKITFLPCRLFTYYGSSSDLGSRFKYHYFNGPKQGNFLGIFLNAFGWDKFSITVVETCPRDMLKEREDWYLSTFKPLLNVLMNSTVDPRRSDTLSSFTRSKISASLLGRIDSDITRMKKSQSRMGSLNPFFGKGPGIKALDLAAEKLGTPIYVYDAKTFTLVEGAPFRSIRMATKYMPVSHGTLPTKLDTGKPFKGYYYYTSPQSRSPK